MSEPTEDDTEDTGRRMDPELRVLSAMLRLLGSIDEPARGRAVRWLADRYKTDTEA